MKLGGYGYEKKILILFLVVLLFANLTACQMTQKISEPAKINYVKIWHYYNGAQKNAFDKLTDEFNQTVGKERGIVVEGINYGDVSQLVEAVLAAANNEVGTEPIPNIFAAYADTAYQVDNLGIVANIGNYINQQELKEIIPSYVEEGMFGDEFKIFPIAKSTEILTINKTDWDKFAAVANVKIEDLATMESLIEVSEKYYNWTDSLTIEKDDGKSFFGRDSMSNYFIMGCRQLGKEIFSVENGKVTFQVDEADMKKLWDNFYVPSIKGFFAANGRFRSDDTKVGDIIAYVGSSTSAAYFPTEVFSSDDKSYSIEAMVVSAPLFEGAEKFAVQQGAGMVVTKTDENMEKACVEFLKWFIDDERNTSFSVLSGYLPVKISANSQDKLKAALDKSAGEDIPEVMENSLEVSLQIVNECEMYTNKAFEGGSDARKVLEHAISDKIKEDLIKRDEMIESGAERQKAIDSFLTEENFQQWLTKLKADLDKSVKGN